MGTALECVISTFDPEHIDFVEPAEEKHRIIYIKLLLEFGATIEDEWDGSEEFEDYMRIENPEIYQLFQDKKNVFQNQTIPIAEIRNFVRENKEKYPKKLKKKKKKKKK